MQTRTSFGFLNKLKTVEIFVDLAVDVLFVVYTDGDVLSAEEAVEAVEDGVGASEGGDGRAEQALHNVAEPNHGLQGLGAGLLNDQVDLECETDIWHEISGSLTVRSCGSDIKCAKLRLDALSLSLR